jgi:serine/threonine-protein kinase
MKLTVARQPVLAYLDGLKPVSGEWNTVGPAALSGKVYPHSVGNSAYACYTGESVEYNLSRGYRRLVATTGIDDNGEDSALRVLVEVFADGRRVLATTIRYGKTTPIAVDVTGVLRLKVQWQPTGGSSSCGSDVIALGDARLLGLPGEVPEPTETPTG